LTPFCNSFDASKRFQHRRNGSFDRGRIVSVHSVEEAATHERFHICRAVFDHQAAKSAPDALLVTDSANFTALQVDFEHVLEGSEHAD
jgi:hypothetical protein